MTIVCRCDECPARFNRDKPMRTIDETFRHWVFKCMTCHNLRTVDKFRAGGTIGAGRREDVPVAKYIGRGM